MTDTSLYADMAKRSGGDIYVGVVGPVRTGKSTFIGRFMDALVLPNIADEAERARAVDELPQSAAGKTVMTTEPKFIPGEAVGLTLDGGIRFRVKMVDCVGYVVPGAMGLIEDGAPRMVKTPWAEEPMPFETAAEIGTRKVIADHATIGVVVTTDGSIGELPRENYESAEARVVAELKERGKPFVVVLNVRDPASDEARALAVQMEDRYGVPVAVVNCLDLDESDVRKILELVLHEFPVRELRFAIPAWFGALDEAHPLRGELLEELRTRAGGIRKVGEVRGAFDNLTEDEYHTLVTVDDIDLATGTAKLAVTVPDEAFLRILGEKTGFSVSDEGELMALLADLAAVKRQYDKIAPALAQVEATGYGIVTPSVEDMELREPEIVHRDGGYGVKLRAKAPSIHMIRADIETEVAPVVGSERQSEDVVKYLLKGFEENPQSLWESNIFGTSLHDLMNEGLNAKLAHMPADARVKLADTLRKIINEGSNGLICILL